MPAGRLDEYFELNQAAGPTVAISWLSPGITDLSELVQAVLGLDALGASR